MLADAPLLAAGKSARKLTKSGSQGQQVNNQPVQRKRRRRKNRNKNRGRKRKGNTVFSLKIEVFSPENYFLAWQIVICWL